jgi:hypothetical protein
MEISIHDNLLISYEVLTDLRHIRFRTEFRDQTPIEKTDILFLGVEAYYFEGDNFSTIIFDIYEVPLEKLIIQEKHRFIEGIPYAWPGAWNDGKTDVLTYLNEKKVHAYSLASSYGMSGWVIASDMKKIQA